MKGHSPLIMLDRFAQPLVKTALHPLAIILARNGVRANLVTVCGFAIGFAALPALAMQAYELALTAILLNRVLDGLDGSLARIQGPTDRGAFLDIALDFVFYGLIPLGFAIADPLANGLPAAVLATAFIGTGSSFLAFAVIAAKRQLTSDLHPRKGIYYLSGLTEGAETIAAFVAACLFPSFFPAIAYAFALACFITTVTRWWHGWTVFGRPPNFTSMRAPALAASNCEDP